MTESINARPAVLLLGLPHASLGIMRSLGRHQIKVYGFSIRPGNIAESSRYCSLLHWPGCNAYDQTLVEHLRELVITKNRRMVTYCLSDEAVEFVNRYRDQLGKYYLFQLAKSSVIDHILSKTKLVSLLQETGVSIPKSFVLDSTNINKVASSLNYPVVLKLAHQKSWKFNSQLKKDYTKLKLINTESELKYWFNRLSRYDELVVQDFIPGNAPSHFYATIYSPGLPREAIVFIGQKLRIDANGFGSETFYRSVENKEIRKICLNFIEKTQYVGFAGIDFKHDHRDTRYKIIEINARLGLSDDLAVQCGLDLPYFYYQHLTGQRYSSPGQYILNKKWLWLLKDFENYVKDWRRQSLIDWIASITTGDICYLVYDPSDIRPFLKDCARFCPNKIGSYMLERVAMLMR